MEEYSEQVVLPELPELSRQFITKVGKIQSDEIDESSGLVASRRYQGVYWTHNDSGDFARIFAIREDGSLVQPHHQNKPYSGIIIPGARNVDWEDIAMDDQGNLIIGAFGNNRNDRRDLGIYIVPEPDPEATEMTTVSGIYRFHFPDQASFPPPAHNRNFDCEAVFYAYDSYYFLTKHWSNRSTKLYRLSNPVPRESNELAFIESFNLRGRVTAADVSENGRVLAILTYSRIWIFIATQPGPNWFSGRAFFIPIRAGQCEGIAWAGPLRLLLTNEGGDIYELDLSPIEGDLDKEQPQLPVTAPAPEPELTQSAN